MDSSSGSEHDYESLTSSLEPPPEEGFSVYAHIDSPEEESASPPYVPENGETLCTAAAVHVHITSDHMPTVV